MISRRQSREARRGLGEAHAALAVGSRSFALAGRVLPQPARDHAAIVYAYCRRADDLVDGVAPEQTAGAVDRLRRELDGIYAGCLQAHPVLAAFQRVVYDRQIPRLYPDELVAGFAMDARPPPIVYETWDELALYCHRVASTVGLMMCHVLGVSDDRALPHAAALGRAMQLTNIARDVAEDWARGRLYVPREAIGGGPVVPGGALEVDVAARLSAAVPALLQTAAPLYRQGIAGLAALPARSAAAIRAAALIYAAIGDRLQAQGTDVLGPRAVVPLRRKLVLVLRALLATPLARLRRPRLGPSRARDDEAAAVATASSGHRPPQALFTFIAS